MLPAHMDCPGCGAPEGYPPAGPCRDHGTMQAVAVEDHTQDCIDAAFMFHAATGGDMECICGGSRVAP